MTQLGLFLIAALGLGVGVPVNHAASFIVSASTGTQHSGGMNTQSGHYNPLASHGLIAVQSAAADTAGTFTDTFHNPPHWSGTEQATARAAAYGTDLSQGGGQNPGLLGYAIEPMADTAVEASCTMTGSPHSTDAGGRAYAVAEIKHRVVARAYPDQLKGILDTLSRIPVRLKYRIHLQTSTTGSGRSYYWNNSASLRIQGHGVSFSDSLGEYSLGITRGGTVEDTRSFDLLRYSATATTNVYTIRVQAETIVEVELSSAADAGQGSAGIFGQSIIDPYLYVDPAWEYAPYFVVQQESGRDAGQWVEVTRGWQEPESTAGPAAGWHFELAGGLPTSLVWPAETGRTYDLWHKPNLDAPWDRVTGFPRAGTGEPMKQPVPPGDLGFFRIQSDDGFVPIPGGEFLMGDQTAPNYEGAIAERPQHAVNLRPFLIARFEVTKALWDVVARWAETNGYDLSAASASGKRSDHPVHGVTWEEGLKWCNARSEKEGLNPCYTAAGSPYRTGPATAVTCDFHADGYRLPTEAEWEMAARGGTSGRRYPWGTDTISHAEANYEAEGTGFGNLSGDAGYHPTWRNGATPYTSPVGSFPGNGYGLHDLAGNLWEWCWDWHGETYYAVSAPANPAGPAEGSKRVIRGGGWVSTVPGDCRVAARDSVVPTASFNDVGFRPVRTVPTPGP